MAGFFQVGDFVNFGRLAWQVYQYGWQDEHNAGKHLVCIPVRALWPCMYGYMCLIMSILS